MDRVYMYGWMGGCMHAWMDGWMGGCWMDWWMIDVQWKNGWILKGKTDLEALK